MHKSITTGLLLAPLTLTLPACSDDTPPETGSTSSETSSTGEVASTSTAPTNPTTTDASSSSATTAVDPTTTDATTGPPPAVCGDGTVDPDEECDDMNTVDTDECTAECKSAACGDGFVWEGMEECDDMNDVDTDECVAGCKLAVCGDGLVWAGMEGCDDMNDVDDDACSNTCVSAMCGDGVIQMGETCDDMNADDTDDCTSLCHLATCGDGFVWAGMEECDDANAEDTDLCVSGCLNAFCGDGFTLAGTEGCDDANMDETDMCTTLCQPPACDDSILSGSESDIDCGGADCPKCMNDQACNAPSDCMSGACDMGVCSPPQTCKDLLAGDPNLANGMYMLDLDGPNGPLTAQNVYCDMKTNGGGWTIFYAGTGVDNEVPMVSDTEANGNPLMFKHYNLNREKKIALSGNSTETLFLRPQSWLKASAPAFDATLSTPMSFAKQQITLTANNGISAPAFMGWSNFNIGSGGDFGITQAPDMMICNGMQMTGFDHHSNLYYMLNCSCTFHYLYSRSSTMADGDAGYDVQLAFGSWDATVACAAAEGGSLVFYAAMR